MSTYADSSKARLWLDGDGFRGTVNASPPADVFATSIAGMDAFGGIKAGFTITPNQDVTDLDVWNNESGAAYYTSKKPPTYGIKFRPVDYSKATTLTLLRGGSIAETGVGSGIFEWIEGDDEEFSLLIRVVNGAKKKAYYIARCTLATIPEEVMNDEDLEGWDMEFKPLAPSGGVKAIRRYTTENPLA
ncbi:MAG: hypothetical protein WBA97_34570 [Actinophytocola sp.]|uniref:hypothetical protein n=1 Tax=Actinophytocola sp. TaxID=1872138 RepID=UPI003C777A34